ncbi:MAB_1171c family putative transporter [Streptomyces sp. TRM 70351]|uniref:MAB_1171c family putative transporter n=1 Tax=Streptomyces sp. TRM 70351 TaxID=3116552 RepID=UPI002E7B3276|nr:MAB_1171c family putative transporter [Streptomyces sp. TRM 70351]MEE1927082.1 MAB_1171c family putative transporter [Streptomyces sp. TRM 70351]
MFYQVLSWSCALGGLVALVYKLPALPRHRGDAAFIALCVYFLCSSLSFFVELDQLRTHIAEILRYQNITTFLCQALVVVLTGAQQVVLVHWSHPPAQARAKARTRIIGYGAALAVLAGLFFFVNPPQRVGTAEVTVLLNLENPRYAVYFSLYLAVCAVGQVEAVRLSTRYARMAHRSWLRSGMWAVAVGASLILVYCLIRYLQIIAIWTGLPEPWDDLYWIAGSVGSLCQVFGWTVPSWGPRLSEAAQWVANFRSYRRLRPLWWALYRANPAIALAPPASRWWELVPPRDLEYRLYRRVIEIRDGQLALRPYMDPAAVRAEAARLGVSAEAPSTAYEALLLRTALTARDTGSAAPAGPSETVTHAPDGDITEEIAWLTQVAGHFRDLPAGRAPAGAERTSAGS